MHKVLPLPLFLNINKRLPKSERKNMDEFVHVNESSGQMDERKTNGPVICLVVDRSGSTQQMLPEIIAGVNSFIEDQKQTGDAELRVIRFDNSVDFVYSGRLVDSPVFMENDFQSRGMTALRDALGTAITHVDSIVPAESLNPSNGVTIVVFTDGEENSSRYFSAASLRKMVQDRQAMGWCINLIGAGIDSCITGRDLGVASERCHTFSRSEADVALRAASAAVTRSRTVDF